MGLAVVHGIVMEMNGAIQVSSELGRGTTVDMFFQQLQMYRQMIPCR